MAAKPHLELACLPGRNHLQPGLHQLRQVVRMHGGSTISQIGPDSDERRERIDDLPKLGFGCPNVLGIPAECFRGTDTADVMTRLLLEHVTNSTGGAAIGCNSLTSRLAGGGLLSRSC